MNSTKRRREKHVYSIARERLKRSKSNREESVVMGPMVWKQGTSYEESKITKVESLAANNSWYKRWESKSKWPEIIVVSNNMIVSFIALFLPPCPN